MNSREEEFDDLTVLGDIGKKRQAFIREKLDVRTYQDLAKLSVDEIVTVFKDAGKPISRKIIEQWIANAKGKWEWLDKIFVVEFRVLKVQEQIEKREMRVHQGKASKEGDWLDNGKEDPEILHGEKLYPWMMQQLGENEEAWQAPKIEPPAEERPAEAPIEKAPPAVAQPPETPAIEALPIKVAIKQISAYLPTESETPIGIGKKGQSFEGSIIGNKPFDLEVEFELPDQTTDNFVERELSYKASFFVHTNGEKKPLGDTDVSRLEPGKVSYKARLPKITLQPAYYRLGVIVKVRTNPSSLTYLVTPEFLVT